MQNIFTERNELDKACFQHNMAYGDFKDLARKTASDNVLRDKAFDFAKNTKCDGCQRGIASKVYIFFDKKSTGSGVNTLGNKSAFNNEKLADKIHKPIIKKSLKRTVYSDLKRISGVLI